MAEVTFPQLIQRACGIDVHLKVVVATIDGAGIQRETRSFKTFTSSLNELKEWLLSNGVTHVGMESTGVYWKPVYKVLEDSIPNVWIVNARHIKNVPGHKTDKMDSEWICKLLLAGLLKPSYIPPKEQRQLRDLTRYRNKLIQQINLNKQLEQSNTALSLKNEQQAEKLKKISKYMDAIQAEMDKFSMSEVEYKEKIKIAHDAIFRLKAMLTVLLVILLGFAFKSGLFA